MKNIILVLSILLSSNLLHANEIKVKGQSNVECSNLLSGGVGLDCKKAAIEAAKINAINGYTATFDSTRLSLYEKIRSQVESHSDDYVVSYSVITEKEDKSSGKYSMLIEAAVNGDKIETKIQEASAAAGSPGSAKSELAFVFVARETISVVKYDARVTKVATKESKVDAAQSGSNDVSSVTQSESAKTENIETTGGSPMQKTDKVSYDVTTASSLDAAITEKFTKSGFDVVDSASILDSAPLKEDYKSGDDISFTTMKNTVAALKGQEIIYFALGTLDVGIKDTDPVSGGVRVTVNVNAKILDLSGKRPKVVAAVGPVQYSGLGQDQVVARVNALKISGEKAAQSLVDQLRAKGLR